MAQVTKIVTNAVPVVMGSYYKYIADYSNSANTIKIEAWAFSNANAQTINMNNMLGEYHILSGYANNPTYLYNNLYRNSYISMFRNNPNLRRITGLNQDYAVNLTGAFGRCAALTEVEIPRYATNLVGAFVDTNIAEAILPETTLNLSQVFYNCRNLTSVNLPSNIYSTKKVYCDSAFSNCVNLTSINQIPHGLSGLYYTFENCFSLTAIPPIPNSIITLEAAFKNSGLTTIPVIPNSVTNMNYAFSGCTNLTGGVDIPDSVVDLYETFYRCNNIDPTNISLPNNPAAKFGYMFYGTPGHESWIRQTKNFNHISSWGGAYAAWKNMVTPPDVIPNTVVNLNSTYSACMNLRTPPIIPEGVTDMGSTFIACTNLTSAPTLPNSVINLASCFASCTRLVEAPVIPSSVVNIYSIFQNCLNIVNAPVIPNSVTNMNRAFNNCTKLNLSTVTLPSSENLDCTSAFSNVMFNRSDFDKINISKAKSLMGLFRHDYTNLYNFNNIHIPDYIINCARLFQGDFTLQEIEHLSNSVTNLSHAFYNCTNLTKLEPQLSPSHGLELPDTIEDLSYAFYNCTNLTVNTANLSNSNHTASIPKNVVNLYAAYYNCSNITLIPGMRTCENLKNLKLAFSGTGIVALPASIPNSIKELDSTFSNCQKLTDIVNINSYSSVQYLNSTFVNCPNIVYVNNGTLPNSLLELNNTFYNCINIKDVYIPKKVQSLIGCFRNCSSLKNVHIYSNLVTNVDGCFTEASQEINVYIPYRYATGEYTETYNTFKAAGYNENGTKDGVYLKSENNYTFSVNPIPSDAIVTIEYDGNVVTSNSCNVPANTIVTYTVSKEDYYSQTATVLVNKATTVDVTLSVYPALTIKTDPVDAIVTLTADGYTQIGNSITAPAGTLITCAVVDPLNRYESQTLTYIMPENSITKEVYLRYEVNKVIFESNTPGIYNVDLRKGNTYTIDIVGAGAGGESMFVYSNYMTISGGSGAYTKIEVPNNDELMGNYILTIGEGSKGITITNEIYLGNSPANGGSSNVISPTGVQLALSKGGYYTPDPYKALGPKGGDYSISSDSRYTITGIKGNNGNHGGVTSTGNNQSPYGMAYGYGGGVTGWNNPNKGGNGYIKITVTGG